MKALRSLMLLGFMVAFVAGSAGWLYSRQSIFRLAEIEVEAESAELRDRIRDRLLGELGQSLFSLSLRRIESEALEFAEVGSVRVRRRWPNAVEVLVSEKRALALEFSRYGLQTLDERGLVIGKLERARGLPLMRGFPGESPEKLEALAWLASLQVETEERGALGYQHIDEVRWEQDEGLRVVCGVLGLEVDLGYEGFARGWERANRGYRIFREQGRVPQFLDASYRNSVIAKELGKTRGELQNSQSDLNLEELGRRTRNPRIEAR
jgi:hypothetical protein